MLYSSQRLSMINRDTFGVESCGFYGRVGKTWCLEGRLSTCKLLWMKFSITDGSGSETMNHHFHTPLFSGVRILDHA